MAATSARGIEAATTVTTRVPDSADEEASLHTRAWLAVPHVSAAEAAEAVQQVIRLIEQCRFLYETNTERPAWARLPNQYSIRIPRQTLGIFDPQARQWQGDRQAYLERRFAVARAISTPEGWHARVSYFFAHLPVHIEDNTRTELIRDIRLRLANVGIYSRVTVGMVVG